MKFSLEHYLQGEALTPFVALNFELGLLDSHRKVHFIPLKCKNFFKLYNLNILILLHAQNIYETSYKSNIVYCILSVWLNLEVSQIKR